MESRLGWVWLAACIGLLAGGCSWSRIKEDLFGAEPARVRVEAPPVQTRDVTWRGWPAVEQQNGLLTLRHVPGAGGRTLSLEIGGDDAFAVFGEHAGKLYAADPRRQSVHFGGHYSAIGPERIWSVADQPFNPHAGPYRVRRRNIGLARHELQLASEPGHWKGATIAIERQIAVERGTTHVTIDETVTNRGDEPLTFYLWDFTQIDALDRKRPGRPMRRLSFYVPVPVVQGRKQYHSFLPPDPAMTAQFDETLPAPVLAIHFQAVQFKVASHAAAWWIAAVDHDSGWTYVKAFEADPSARYVDDNGPIEVYGSNRDNPRPEPFVEMELLTGISRYRPGESLSQREHWYATTCTGPVLALTPVGVVCDPLHARRDKDYADVSGRFGVFHLGTARVEAVDRDGETVYRSEPVLIDPRAELELSVTCPVTDEAKAFVLRVYDRQGTQAGELARTTAP